MSKVELTLREKKIFVSIQILRVNWTKSSLFALGSSLQKMLYCRESVFVCCCTQILYIYRKVYFIITAPVKSVQLYAEKSAKL